MKNQHSFSEDRHYALDGIRGLAALAVANYHFLFYAGGVRLQSMGTFTVYLFFALSALTMMMVYGHRFAAGIFAADLGRFYRARVARIIPLLVLISIIAALLGSSWWTSGQAILTGSGLFALGPAGLLSVGHGAWSLAIELAFYAIFPIAAIMLGRLSQWSIMLLVIVAVAAQQVHIAMIADLLVSDPAQHWRLYTSPITFAPFFLIGFVVYSGRKRRLPHMWLLMLALFAVIAGFSLLYPVELFASPVAYLGLTAAVAALIYTGWRTELPLVLVPVANFLAEISYALYLTHALFLGAAQKAGEMLGLSLWLTWAAFLVSAMGGAWLCYRCFERPMRQRLRVPRRSRGAVAASRA